jgi:acyl carrier protein
MLSQSPNRQELQTSVLEEVVRVLEEKDVGEDSVPDVSSERRLGEDLGMSSLELAQLVARLEMKLQADPFQELVAITSVRTVADLCKAYERFFFGQEKDAGEAEALNEGKRRAEARSRVRHNGRA